MQPKLTELPINVAHGCDWKHLFLYVIALCLLLGGADAAADGPRVYPVGKQPDDSRRKPLRDLNSYFPFKVPETREAWGSRSNKLRRLIRVAAGLWPMPTETPLNAVVYGRVDRPGFTVERVYFESYPQHFVTGLLFRPKNDVSKRPAVISPHGHGGRLQDLGEKGVLDAIKSGAEKYAKSGRFPKLARCAHLARMGCVVFIYDMEGYADSVQIPMPISHRFRIQRPELNRKDAWGFYSAQAELRFQSILGLQIYNSIRALDFLTSLPDVDPKRVGVTGGSGGGTQTILLGAIDPRPIASFPQGMVSTAMQGGCTCENMSMLRINTGNVELAALFAPKPLGMTAANDWTKEMMTKGYPELQQLYGMLGVKEKVLCESLLHFPHNYNFVTRKIMYEWFNKHLKLGLSEPIVETDYEPLTPAEYTVWNDQHPRPTGGPEHEVKLLRWIDKDTKTQLAKLAPKDKTTLEKYRKVVGGALETIVWRSVPGSADVKRTNVLKEDKGKYLLFADKLQNTAHHEEVALTSVFPKQNYNGQAVIWIDGNGKDACFLRDGSLIGPIEKLLTQGYAVTMPDLLYMGESSLGSDSQKQLRRVGNSREYAGYTLGYNDCLVVQRCHDIQTVVAFIKGHDRAPGKITLVGVNGAHAPVSLAAAVTPEITNVVVDTKGFRFVDIKSIRDTNLLPGVVKYGDLPGLLSMVAPRPLTIVGEAEVPKIVRQAYSAAGAKDAAKISKAGVLLP